MPSFKKDYELAKGDAGVAVLMERKEELNRLEKELRYCKNQFRAQCLYQEIQRKREEYRKIDELF